MHLILGVAPPDHLRTQLVALQSQFWSDAWEPASFLMLPLCKLGEVTSPLILEELDHGLLGLRGKGPATLAADGFGVFTRRDRISLELKIRAPVLHHLSVKIGTLAKRAGVKNPHVMTPLSIPLATITNVDAEDVSAWLQVHHSTPFEEDTISEITLFSTWKNSETTFYTTETEYTF